MSITPVTPVNALPDPATLTLKDVKAWGSDTRRFLAVPEIRAKVDSLLAERATALDVAAPAPDAVEVPPTPTEEEVKAAEVAAQVKADEELLAAKAKLEADTKAEADRKAAETPKKIVVRYQATDENGQPIGSPTYLEAATHEEMVEKQKQAHINATRAYHRLKKQKDTAVFKQPETVLPTEEELLEAAKDLSSDDPAKKLAAARKIANADIEKEREANRKEANRLRGIQVGLEFRTKHPEFNPCQANSLILGQYLEANNLEFTVDNLEIALAAEESRLTPAVQPAVEVVQVPPVPANTPEPVTVIPAAPVEPAAPVVQPAPPPNPVVAPVAPPKRTGDLQPGAQSGRKPVVQPVGLTKADINKMPRDEYKRRLKIPHLRAEIERVLNS